MTFAIGGSAKVRRIVKEPKRVPWACECYATVRKPRGTPRGEMNPASLIRCPTCGTKRP